MTKRERLVVLAIFISVLGFSFITSLKPVMHSYISRYQGSITQYSIRNEKVQLKTVQYASHNAQDSKMVRMLSEVLDISKGSIISMLDGGSKPNEILLSSGILLSDLSEEYSFDIVGGSLVRFRA